MLRRISRKAYLDLGNDEICKLRPLGIEDWNDTNEGLSPFCSQCMRFRLRCCLHVQELPEVSQESACVSHEFLRFLVDAMQNDCLSSMGLTPCVD